MKLFLIFLFFSSGLMAQVATNSFFRETKAVNPAVISHRPAAIFSVIGKIDEISKEQDLSGSFVDGKSNVDIGVKTGSIFYGGRGKGLTSEIMYEHSLGTKKLHLESATEETDSSDDVSSMFFNWGVGLGKNYGVSFGLLRYKYSSNMQANFGGEDIDLSYENNTLVQIVKFGARYGSRLSLGIFGELMHSGNDFEDSNGSDSSSTFYPKVGLGIATSGKSTHFEISYERNLLADDYGEKSYTASRIIAVAEIRFGFLALGYVAKYSMEGYMDAEGLLYNALAYGNSINEPRLEHGVNFSLGSNKGHSLSGSIYYSKINTQEGSTLFANFDSKFATTTEAYGASIKYAYAF